MGIKNPQELTTEEYYQAYADYLFLQTIEREFQLNILRQAISEALSGEG